VKNGDLSGRNARSDPSWCHIPGAVPLPPELATPVEVARASTTAEAAAAGVPRRASWPTSRTRSVVFGRSPLRRSFLPLTTVVMARHVGEMGRRSKPSDVVTTSIPVGGWRLRLRAAGLALPLLVAAAVAAVASGAAGAATTAAAAATTDAAAAAAAVSLDPVVRAAMEGAALSSPSGASSSAVVAPIGTGDLTDTAAAHAARCPAWKCLKRGAYDNTIKAWRTSVKKTQKGATWARTARFAKLAWTISTPCGGSRPGGNYRCFSGAPGVTLSKILTNVVLRPQTTPSKAPKPTGRKAYSYYCAACAAYYFRWGSQCCFEGCRSMTYLGGSAGFMMGSCCETLGTSCNRWRYRETNPTFAWTGFR